MMDLICNGCLNNVHNRAKIRDLEIIECYRSLVEDKMDISELSVCWACHNLLMKFLKFKKKVQYAYNVLQQASQTAYAHSIKPLTPLYQEKILFNINFNPELPQNEGFELISNKSVDSKIKTEDSSEIDAEESYQFSETIDKLELKDNLEITDNKDSTIDKSEFYKNVKKQLAEIRKESKKRSNAKTTNKEGKKIKSKKHKIHSEKEGFNNKEDCFKEVELGKKEVADERSILLNDSNYVNALYKCENCIESFPNSDDMKDHFDNKHKSNNEFKCQICECTFSNTLSFTYHCNRHTVRYQCIRCDQRFATKTKVVKHYEEYHDQSGKRGFWCVLCQLDFSTEVELCLHKKSQQHTTAASLETPPATELHSCKLCDKTFKWKTSLNKHLEKHRIASGQKRRPFCEICGLTFTQSASLRKHVKTSSKHQMLLKERKVKEGASTESTCERERKHACSLCGKRFQWKGNLQRHLSSHAARAAGELVCVPCDRTFSSIATYKQHMNISRKHVSEDDYQYKCDQCEAKFVSKSKLKDHIDWEHLKNYIHSCGTCKKVFKSHTSLYLHRQVVHRREGDIHHLCDHCGKSFPHVGKLRSHMSAIHSGGQAPYKCAVCGTTFNWHSCLSRHVRLVHKHTAT